MSDLTTTQPESIEETITLETEPQEAPTPETVIMEITETVFGTSETITPYALHNIVNGALEALGSGKRIRPQMMYNYSRNGLLVKGEKGIKALTKDQSVAFATKYVTKQI